MCSYAKLPFLLGITMLNVHFLSYALYILNIFFKYGCAQYDRMPSNNYTNAVFSIYIGMYSYQSHAILLTITMDDT